MSYDTVYSAIARAKIVPVIAIDDAEAALPLADALIAGGLPVAEITFRTDAAAAVIRTLKEQRPEILLGAGTVLTVENLRRAADCGATFAVAPGLNPRVVQEAQRVGIPFTPGVMTPSEIEHALSLGVKVLKFFPAGDAGGPKMLKSLSGPYAHTGVRFIPTGGVTLENLSDYLAVPTVLAVGGTWIAKREDIRDGNWKAIEENCRRAVAAAAG